MLVEAIVDGRIVFVSEEQAKREGYPILRKPEPQRFLPTPEKIASKPIQPRGIRPFDELRKPLKSNNNVLNELVNNFHWILIKRRKELGYTRKQVAEKISANEYELKLIESGILPKDDFVLISKLEQFYSINLRKSFFSDMPALPDED